LLGQEVKLIINKLNNNTDGIASYNGMNIYVGNTLVGDEVIAKIYEKREGYAKAKLLEIVKPSSMRITPPCRYYDKCGGCNMQHFNKATYLGFKEKIADEIVSDLTNGSLKTARIFETGFNDRRKLNLKISFETELKIGFFKEMSHQVVDIAECLVADDRINNLIPHIRALLSKMKIKRILKEITIYDLGHSFDIMLNSSEYLTKFDKVIITEFCLQNNIARFSQNIDQENIIFDNKNAYFELKDIKIFPPINYFIQASAKVENRIVDVIKEHVSQDDNVLDLFAGLGTYSFSIYGLVKNITAYEGSKNMVNVTKKMIAENQLESVNVFYRDLFKRPIAVKDLSKFDKVIINPPRDGAKNQIIQISKSKIRKIIMVSCNPVTFKRDSKILIKAGFKMTYLQALDQFYANTHLELIAIFEN
jgi:23S rRNA (uracil1939-C5)-methyltransferase